MTIGIRILRATYRGFWQTVSHTEIPRGIRMLRQLSLVFVFSMLPLAADAQEAANGPLELFTVSVVDQETGEPITEFEYRFYLAKPRYEGELKPWVHAETKNGAVTLQLPPSCRFRFFARAHGYVYDPNMSRSQVVRTTDKERKLTHTLMRGTTVSGRIIDFATQKPIENARISPTYFCAPGYCTDHELSVFSDADGRFSITGINPKDSWIRVEHPEYMRSGWSRRNHKETDPEPTDNVVIELDRGETAFGVVLAPDGSPIEGAEVQSYDTGIFKTGPDGKFRISGLLRDPSRRGISINVEKPGYMDFNTCEPEIPEDGLRVVLKPLFEIRGRVLDAEGRPIKKFTVMAGPGKAPWEYKRISKQVQDDDGRFSIGLDTGLTGYEYERIAEGNWFTIKAEGYALYEDWIAYDPKGVDLNIKLDPGVSVEGSLSVLPKNFGGGEVVLLPDPLVDTTSARRCVPRPWKLSPTQAAGKLAATIAPDGTFSFNGVRPGEHEMTINGKGITHARLTVKIPDKDTIIDPIEITASGRIEGQAFNENGEPWVFKEGCLFHKEYDDVRSWSRSFMTDEDGRFVLEDVPADRVGVGIVRQCTADVFTVDAEDVYVMPGETSRVVLNDPELDISRDACFRIRIGDGSQAQRESGTAIASKRQMENVIVPHPILCVVLDPIHPTNARTRKEHRHTFDPSNMLTVANVADGEYRVRVFDSRKDWHHDEGPLYDGKIDFKASADPIEIQLGAGAITGTLRLPVHREHSPSVVAIRIDEGNRLYSGYSDLSGAFCVRYLPPGEYVLYCVEPANGCCRSEPIHIADNLIDVGELDLRPGAVVRGTTHILRPCEIPTAIQAVNEYGFVVRDWKYLGCTGEPYKIVSLLPGTWTLKLMSHDKVLASETIKIEGTETIDRDIFVR